MIRKNTPGAARLNPTIKDIKLALERPLPGWSAQSKMAPELTPEMQPVAGPTEQTRQGAVMLVLYEQDADFWLPLTRRTESLAMHRGQISLPGGERLEGESLLETARRETHEEIGLEPRDLIHLGNLSSLYIPVSDFCIYPFVGYCPYQPAFNIDTVEVAELLPVSISHLLDDRYRRIEYWEDTRFPQPRRVPCFLLKGRIVWGATAMVLSEFLSVLN